MASLHLKVCWPDFVKKTFGEHNNFPYCKIFSWDRKIDVEIIAWEHAHNL